MDKLKGYDSEYKYQIGEVVDHYLVPATVLSIEPRQAGGPLYEIVTQYGKSWVNENELRKMNEVDNG